MEEGKRGNVFFFDFTSLANLRRDPIFQIVKLSPCWKQCQLMTSLLVIKESLSLGNQSFFEITTFLSTILTESETADGQSLLLFQIYIQSLKKRNVNFQTFS